MLHVQAVKEHSSGCVCLHPACVDLHQVTQQLLTASEVAGHSGQGVYELPCLAVVMQVHVLWVLRSVTQPCMRA